MGSGHLVRRVNHAPGPASQSHLGRYGARTRPLIRYGFNCYSSLLFFGKTHLQMLTFYWLKCTIPKMTSQLMHLRYKLCDWSIQNLSANHRACTLNACVVMSFWGIPYFSKQAESKDRLKLNVIKNIKNNKAIITGF